MKIKITKDYKLMKVDDVVNVDPAYGAMLIKKGVASEVTEQKKK